MTAVRAHLQNSLALYEKIGVKACQRHNQAGTSRRRPFRISATLQPSSENGTKQSNWNPVTTRVTHTHTLTRTNTLQKPHLQGHFGICSKKAGFLAPHSSPQLFHGAGQTPQTSNRNRLLQINMDPQNHWVVKEKGLPPPQGKFRAHANLHGGMCIYIYICIYSIYPELPSLKLYFRHFPQKRRGAK